MPYLNAADQVDMDGSAGAGDENAYVADGVLDDIDELGDVVQAVPVLPSGQLAPGMQVGVPVVARAVPVAPSGGLSTIMQGVGQALGLGPAMTPIGSLFGAGIGGVDTGTGPLPAPMGLAAQQAFGQPSIPPGAGGLYPALTDHTEKVGRAIVRRILGATLPQIDAIRQLVEYRRNQIQATAEHSQLATAQAFQNEVVSKLQALQGSVAAGALATGPTGQGGWERY